MENKELTKLLKFNQLTRQDLEPKRSAEEITHEVKKCMMKRKPNVLEMMRCWFGDE